MKCERRTSVNWIGKLKEQWKLGSNCDVKLVVGNGEILVHRCLLAASCSYFKALFNADFKEKHSKIFDLSQTFDSAEILQNILGFIYGESITISTENVECLLQYSDFLNLDELTKHGVNFLLKNLTLRNCLWTWSLADRFRFVELKEVCYEIAECNFDTIMEFESTLSLPTKQMVSHLKDGIAKHMNYSQVEKFIDSYIKYDVEIRKDCKLDMWAAYMEGQKGTIQQSQARASLTADEYDEAVLIQSISGHTWLIYSLKDNRWYSGDHIYKAISIGQTITTVGIGPHCDYIMTGQNELLSARTMTFLRIKPILCGGPEHNIPNLQLMHSRNCKDFYAVCWFTSRSTSFVGLPFLGQAEGNHGFYLYQLDLCQREWNLIETVYETRQVVECFHAVQSNEDNLYILVIQPNSILLFHFAALAKELVQLKTFYGDASCRPRWEIFANNNVMILWNEKKEKSLHYSFHSNQWSVHKRISLSPTELETGWKTFYAFAKSKCSGKIYMISTRHNITKAHFVSYDPVMKETTELCPLPIDFDVGSLRPSVQWQIVPRKFFSYLKPATFKSIMNKKLLSTKLVEECFSKYQRRINKEPEMMDDENTRVFQFMTPRCPPQNMLEAMQEKMMQQMVQSSI